LLFSTELEKAVVEEASDSESTENWLEREFFFQPFGVGAGTAEARISAAVLGFGAIVDDEAR
jgi:hypothetical protein